MSFTPPTGSRILVKTDGLDSVIVVPQGSAGPLRYFIGLFLLFWLGGWVVGARSALSSLWSGAGSAFLVFWLGGWTIGGLFAMLFAYRMFRPSVPETLRLTLTGLSYDTGIAPFQMPPVQGYGGYVSPRDAWKSLFPRRVRANLDRRQLQSLKLRPTDTGNRLTVDVDAERLDLAQSATEIEREWLYQVLAKRYSLPPAAEPRAR